MVPLWLATLGSKSYLAGPVAALTEAPVLASRGQGLVVVDLVK
jgi:hypothetical protein